MSIKINSTVKKYPSLPYDSIAASILGKRYEVTLTFIGGTRAQRLNEKYRRKTYTPNILTFPLADTHGELYICPEKALREYKEYDVTYEQYIGYLFIHGCLHLKGYHHGATMESAEERWMKRFFKVVPK